MFQYHFPRIKRTILVKSIQKIKELVIKTKGTFFQIDIPYIREG